MEEKYRWSVPPHGHAGAGSHVTHLDRLVAPFGPKGHGRVDHPLPTGLLFQVQHSGRSLVLHAPTIPGPWSSPDDLPIVRLRCLAPGDAACSLVSWSAILLREQRSLAGAVSCLAP